MKKRKLRTVLIFISVLLGIALGCGAFFLLTEEKPPRAALSPTDKEQGSDIFSREGFLYKKTEDGLILFSAMSALPEKVIIPDNIDGLPVVAIDEAAFYARPIKEVIIPDTVRSIGKDAFNSCSELGSVKLSENLEIIGDGAFSFCSSLKSVDIPDTVSAIGADGFADCSQLEYVSLPKKLISIGDGAFENCLHLENVTLPDGLKEIGEGAFRDCSFGEITIPDSVEYIGPDAFWCTGFTAAVYAPRERSYYGQAGEHENCKWIVTD